MYGLPNQKLADWKGDLYKAIAINPDHISFYGLTIDEGTEFHRRYAPIKLGGELPDDDEMWEMYYKGIDILKGSDGYKQYEISNFARPGYECRHNLNYWRQGKYYGIGPGAVGFNGRERIKVVSDVNKYIEHSRDPSLNILEVETLTDEQLISEAIMLGLRLKDGINLAELSEKYNTDVAAKFESTIDSLVRIKMLARNDDVIRLTRKALYVSNSVMSEFMTC